MFRKWNRFLAFLLSLALVITTFGSDLATAKVYADEGEVVAEQAPEQEDTAPEIFEEIPQTEEEVAPPAEENPEEVIDEAGEEGADEENPENPEGEDLENPEGEDLENPEDEDEAKDPEEEPEVAEGEEKIVTVTYESGFGGSVSKDSESIDINKEDAAFEGATATPWNDKYTFANWTKDGEVVSEEATFVPADITEDTTFKANFKAAENIGEEMPSINESVTTGGMNVSVSAPVGLFPKGTTVSIEAIGDDEALATAQEAIPEAKAAKGVDITFHDADGNEIQPANNKYVSVTMSLVEALEGDNFAVVHDHGDVETIGASISTDGDGNATEATFASGEFSVFIIASTDDDSANKKNTITYKFWEDRDMTTEFNSQIVKKGDSLVNPGVPGSISNDENQLFIGWETEDGDPVAFGEITEEPTTETEVINVIPVVQVTYYVQFHGLDDEIAHVASYTVTDPDDDSQKYVNAIEEYSLTADSGKAFAGWSTSSAEDKSTRPIVNNGGENRIDVTDPTNRNLYAVVIEAYWIHFEGNGIGATYTEPTYLKFGQKLSEMSGVSAPSRDGYAFKGWSMTSGAGNTPLSDTELAKEIQEVADSTKTLTLYASWEAEGKTSVTVILWNQKVTDKYDTAIDAREYDYKSSATKDGFDVGSDVDADLINSVIGGDYTVTGEKGFHFDDHVKIVNSSTGEETTKVEARGNTIVNVYYERDVITLTFNEYGRTDGYQPTTEDNYYTTYYGTTDNADYFELRKVTEQTDIYFTYEVGSWWSSETRNYTGTVYYNAGSYYRPNYVPTTDYSQNRNYFGYVDGQLIYLDRHVVNETYWVNKATGAEYTGTRYKKVQGQSAWGEVETYTALYGQTLSYAGYTWPADAAWYDDYSGSSVDGKHVTFIDTFLNNEQYYATTRQSGNHHVTHYKENLAGTGYAQANDTLVSGNSTFYFSNKYEGFVIDHYKRGSGNSVNITYSYDQYGDHYSPASADLNNNNLSIYYKRKSYNLTFVDVVPGDNTTSEVAEYSVKYEAPLSAYADQTNDKTHDGYTFKGWFEDKSGTVEFGFSNPMPAADKIVYGVWEPTKYKVTLLGNGGTITADADTRFKKDEAGNPYFSIDPFKEEVLESGVAGVFEREGYVFTGYYYADGDKKDQPFLYGKINGDVTLKAGWRRVEAVIVQFNADPDNDGKGSFDEGKIHTDGFSYASDSSFVVAAPPTTVNEKYIFMGWQLAKGNDQTIHIPNECVDIQDDMISDTENVVVLNAVYEEKGGSGTSTETADITFYANDGSTNKKEFTYKKNLGFNALANDAFTRDGYELIGWSLVSGDDNASDKFCDCGTLIGIDNNQPMPNELYAIWEKTTGSYVVKYYKGEELLNEPDDLEPVEAEIGAEITADDIDVDKYLKKAGVGYKSGKVSPETTTIVAGDEPQIIKVVYEPVKVTVEVKGTTTTLPYNGQEQSAPKGDDKGYKVTKITYDDPSFTTGVSEDDIKVADGVTIGTVGKDIGTYKFGLADSDFAYDGDFPDVEIKVIEDGKLVITPIDQVTVTIKGVKGKKPYTGSKQSVTGFTFEATNNLFTADDFTYKGKSGDAALAVAIAEGTDVNDDGYAMGLDESDFAKAGNKFDNVVFVVDEDGLLEITPRTVNLTIKGKVSYPVKKFNGKKQEENGFDEFEAEVVEAAGAETPAFDIDSIIYDENVAHAEGIAPGEYPMGLKATMFTLDPEEKNFAIGEIDLVDGKLIIENAEEPIEIILTAEEIVSPYNGYTQRYVIRPGVGVVESQNPVQATIDKIMGAIASFFTITADAADEDPTFDIDGNTYVVKGLTVTAEGRDVGSYDFSYNEGYTVMLGDDDVTENFYINDEGLAQKLTITKAKLTITADNKSKVVNAAEPELTATVTGLVGEDAGINLKDAYYSLNRDSGETVGSYTIHTTKVEQPTFDDKNYEVELVNGTFTITGTTPTPTPTPPTPTPTPTDPGTPAAPPAAPAGAVLGATREVEGPQAAVLGARRGRTEDSANTASRVIAVIIAAAVAATVLLTKKKNEEEEEA